MNKKGFTLIELLAVIVILGIVIAIAIPSINLVITNTRRSAFISDAKMFANAARLKLISGEIKQPTSTRATVVSLELLDLEKGGVKSSYGSNWNFEKNYILIHNEETEEKPKNVYYIAQLDQLGNGIELTEISELTKENIVNQPNILPLGKAPLLGNITGRINKIDDAILNNKLSSVTELRVYTKNPGIHEVKFVTDLILPDNYEIPNQYVEDGQYAVLPILHMVPPGYILPIVWTEKNYSSNAYDPITEDTIIRIILEKTPEPNLPL